MTDLLRLYQEKSDFYCSVPREPIIEIVNRTGLKVLDVGCSNGQTGKRLLELGKARWVTGIEFVPERGEAARAHLNEVYVGDVESMSFDWQAGAFDCFIFGDVLEHLSDPWQLLKRLQPFLATDGMIVASIPNVKHMPVLLDLLLRDEWLYVESGVLDITHLRFFTRKTAIRLFEQSGYKVEAIRPLFNGRRYSMPNQVTFGMAAGFLAQAWLMRLRAS
jgi:2-polyprenyl-3-methyl-5-hydroxy-6-metoxy-1,4-benzoquinol methylase